MIVTRPEKYLAPFSADLTGSTASVVGVMLICVMVSGQHFDRVRRQGKVNFVFSWLYSHLLVAISSCFYRSVVPRSFDRIIPGAPAV